MLESDLDDSYDEGVELNYSTDDAVNPSGKTTRWMALMFILSLINRLYLIPYLRENALLSFYLYHWILRPYQIIALHFLFQCTTCINSEQKICNVHVLRSVCLDRPRFI